MAKLIFKAGTAFMRYTALWTISMGSEVNNGNCHIFQLLHVLCVKYVMRRDDQEQLGSSAAS
jgi:hypothetical protein